MTEALEVVVSEVETAINTENGPYLITEIVRTVWAYRFNPDYEPDKECSNCQHSYDRHFDSYEDMRPVGCKYCSCHLFGV